MDVLWIDYDFGILNQCGCKIHLQINHQKFSNLVMYIGCGFWLGISSGTSVS
jgi:hypothetical protein